LLNSQSTLDETLQEIQMSDELKEKSGWFSKLKNGLKKSRVNIVGLFTGGVVDEAFLEELEFQLIAADVGVETSAKIIDRLKD
jgi:fused signal recognition particle receptor